MNTCPVLVGRHSELEFLESALARGGLVLVSGEAGIGKTRLLQEFERGLGERGIRVVWGRPETMTRPGPYSLVVDLLENLASIVEPEGEEAVRLATALAREEAGEETPARQIAARLRGLLTLLGNRPVAIVEDLHDADELSHAVFAHFAKAARDDGVTLIGTYRSEQAGRGGFVRFLDLVTRGRAATEIELGPLDSTSVREMLSSMWEGDPSEADVTAIYRLGEGIPFFIEELAAAHGARPGAVPPSITRAVLARMEALDTDGQRVIQAAALMSGAIDPAVLADACGVPETGVPRYLIQASRAGLLIDQEDRLTFRHALLKDAIASTLVSVEMKAMHRRLAEAIESCHGNELDTHAQALEFHWRRAGERDRAATFASIAGERALKAGALEEADALLSEALHASDSTVRARARRALAEVQLRVRKHEEALALLREAVHEFERDGDQVQAAESLLRLAWIQYVLLGIRSLPPELDQAASLAEGIPGGEHVVVRALLEKGYILTRVLSDARGEKFLQEGLEKSETLGSPSLQADAHMALAWSSEIRGNLKKAGDHGRLATAFSLQSGEPEVISKILANEALRLALHGQSSDALELLDEARARLTGGIGSQQTDVLDHMRCWVLWRSGNPGEAERFAGRLEATRLAHQYGRVVRTWAACERGEVQRAEAVVRAWWDELGGSTHRANAIRHPHELPDAAAPEIYAILAELIVAVHRDTHPDNEVLEMARIYYEFCEPAPYDIGAVAGLLLARLLIGAREYEAADDVIRQVVESLRGRGYAPQDAAASELQAISLYARRDIEAALASLERAIMIYETCANLSDRARCLRMAAQFREELGNQSRAIDDLREARELAVQGGAVAELNRIEAAMRKAGLRPRVGRPKGSGLRGKSLSTREEEVVALVAAGATNSEIGSRLFLSTKTVENHITRALRRLGLSSRASLAAWAVKEGIV